MGRKVGRRAKSGYADSSDEEAATLAAKKSGKSAGADSKVAGKKTAGKAAKKRGVKTDDVADQPDSAEALRTFVDSLAGQLHFDVGDSSPAAGVSVKEEAPELLGVLRKMRQQLGSLRQAAGMALETFAGAVDATEGNATYVEMKVQLLMSYVAYLVYYMLLKTKGVTVVDHPVVPRLIWISTLLDKLRPVDQRVQYQISKLLQWAAAQGIASSGSREDLHALKPGDLALGVDDEDDEAEENVQAATPYEDDGIYKPPRVSQMDYTGDHMTMKAKAEKDLERKKGRLDRSEFVRTLREEFTDAPTEIKDSLMSVKAEKGARIMREQREYEEDNMTRLKVNKKERKVRTRVANEGRMTGAGLDTLHDATTDFREIERGIGSGRGRGKGKGKGRKGSALQEYRDASSRASHARGVVNQTLEGVMPGSRSSGGGAAKRRKTS